MDELLQKLTGSLGLDESVAKTGLGKVLGMVKDQVGDDTYQQIADKVPGMDTFVAEQGEAETPTSAGGGLLGSIASKASGMLGGNAGKGLELTSALTSAGVSPDKLGGFVSTVVAFLREKAGDQVVDQVLGKFPLLKKVMG